MLRLEVFTFNYPYHKGRGLLNLFEKRALGWLIHTPIMITFSLIITRFWRSCFLFSKIAKQFVITKKRFSPKWSALLGDWWLSLRFYFGRMSALRTICQKPLSLHLTKNPVVGILYNVFWRNSYFFLKGEKGIPPLPQG